MMILGSLLDVWFLMWVVISVVLYTGVLLTWVIYDSFSLLLQHGMRASGVPFEQSINFGAF